MEEKSVLDTYEQKRQWVRQFNLTSDLFAGKVFEDLAASQGCGLRASGRSM